MKKRGLHENFINALRNRFEDRKQLVSIIADILKIDREPALRRVNGTVLFTADEIGIVAEEMDMSLDSLLKKNENYSVFPLSMIQANGIGSIDVLADFIDMELESYSKSEGKFTEIGTVFDSLPLEFSIPFLSKFKYYSWEHNFVKAGKFKDYTSWEYPEIINSCYDEVIRIFKGVNKVMYIWDVPVIWNLMKSINYFWCLEVLKDEHVGALKDDIHSLLTNLELLAKGDKSKINFECEVEIYIPNVTIGSYAFYYLTENNAYCKVSNAFMKSSVIKDTKTCMDVYNWINSMKGISTLISGSGEIDRKAFFEEQHRIVDNM